MQDLSLRFPVWFCDIWGVVHNGVKPFAGTVDALKKHRQSGGIVILVTNAPRTSPSVAEQLAGLGVDPASYTAIVTSGDVTRALIEEHGGGRVFHLGPSRDHSIFRGLTVRQVELEEAHAVLCTGLFDDSTETPEDYAELLSRMKARNLEMICANPDRMVRKGDRLIYCAGAIANAYAEAGGTVLMAGKPYRPIYELAQSVASGIAGRPVRQDEILAIGDGPETDIRGAADYGIPALLVAEGVTDASAGLAAAEEAVQRAVPAARIIRTVRSLAWE